MPVLRPDVTADADHTRRSLRLDPATLGLALLLGDPAARATTVPARLAVLEAAGITVAGRTDRPVLRPWCGALLDVVATAPDEVAVEVAAAGSRQRISLPLLGARAAMVEHLHDGTLTITELATSLVPARIASLVGLDPTAPVLAPAPCPSALSLARFHEYLLEGDTPGAGAVLGHQGAIDTDGLRVLRDLATGEGRAWRVSGSHGLVMAIATGHGGLWAATSPAGARLGMTPLAARVVYAAIHAMVSAAATLAGTRPATASSAPPPRPPCPPSAPTPSACCSSPGASTSSASD